MFKDFFFNKLHISLAKTPGDFQQISALSSRYGEVVPNDARTHRPVSRPMFVKSPDDQVIKATLSGSIVASVRLGLARNEVELNEQFDAIFPWKIFPVMTVKEACAEPDSAYDRPLRFISLALAQLLEIDGAPIEAQLGEIVASNALGIHYMKTTPLRPHLLFAGRPVDSNPRVGNVIVRREIDFATAITDLQQRVGIPSFVWDGPLPFQNHFSPDILPMVQDLIGS